ncbi:hypothetical protein SAMN05660420_00829 [Desulfuromusa kysingii]|uniref:Nicotinamide riboside transporter PnuC n=1 Tax=Desulfuromusa kysingii TaxID=37625 RepID=A0A1H3X6G9_9BACT|nr:hypothetical protein [Desulfuromusa kysingii]SDZ94541.1 hypothetical protein SAMN05660420_00829 [Desulfuromusa kysingii]
MDLLLQVWGGSFYLANKILLAVALSRTDKNKRLFRLLGWWIYILGVPAWVIVLASKQNWIAASIEAGGVPSMLLGLYSVYKQSQAAPKKLIRLAKSVTYAAIIFGIGYSIYTNGGINSLTQLLEIGTVVGFLLGSYLLALNQLTGWLFFALMNGSMATLMLIQDKPILSIQQLCSLCFVVYGFIVATKMKNRS